MHAISRVEPGLSADMVRARRPQAARSRRGEPGSLAWRERRPAGRQAGAAVVTALLIVMLATTVVAGLFVRENVALRSVENRQALAQARWIERAALDWAKVILSADEPRVDSLDEPWATPVADTSLDETVTGGARIGNRSYPAMLAGQIFDAQAMLNLNALVDNNGKPVDGVYAGLQQLLDLLGLSPSLADTVRERVVAGHQRKSGDGVVQPASMPAMLHLADLLALPGFDAATVDKLTPFVTVLPSETTKVNLNTAPAELIAALVPGIDLSAARRFVADRERGAVTDLSMASSRYFDQLTLPADLLSVNSNFFLVRGMVRFDRVEAHSETLLERRDKQVEIVWQQRY